MENNNDWEDCLKSLALLSPKQLDAIGWLINNFELAVKMCKDSNITQARREHLMKRARETDDGVLELLLVLDEVLKQDQSYPKI